MSNLDFNALSKDAKTQLALTLATFILHDSKTPINSENLNKVLKASHNDAPANWANAFAHTLENTPVDKFLSCGSSSQGAAPAQTSAPAKTVQKAEAKKEEVKEEEAEVDFDMGDMFG